MHKLNDLCQISSQMQKLVEGMLSVKATDLDGEWLGRIVGDGIVSTGESTTNSRSMQSIAKLFDRCEYSVVACYRGYVCMDGPAPIPITVHINNYLIK